MTFNILKNQYTSIQDLLLLKKNTIKGINKFVAIKGIDSVKIKQMNQLKAELSSKKYSSLYLNSIYSKTYANFLIAKTNKYGKRHNGEPLFIIIAAV